MSPDDQLRYHLASAHCLGNALDLTATEAHQAHEDEHNGPCTIRNHPRNDRTYDRDKARRVIAEAAEMDGPTDRPRSFVSRALSAEAVRAEVVRQSHRHGIIACAHQDVVIAACTELLGAMLAESRLTVSKEIADALQERSGRRPSSWAAAAEIARQIGGGEPTEHSTPDDHRCPACGSTSWVSVSLDEGYTRRAQCVPCGKVHAPLGPGWRQS